MQVYDAPSHTASNTFLTLRAKVSTDDAFLTLTSTESDSRGVHSRCPLPVEKVRDLLKGDNPDLFKPGGLCRCVDRFH
jgi:hypothetical protein